MPWNSFIEEGLELLGNQLWGVVSTPVHGFMGSKRFVKLKVHMPLSQQLKDWVKVDHPTLGEVLVHYSYEKVTRVCTFCGFLGHELQGCNER